MKYTAHEIAADPELYNRVYRIGKYKMECFGYSKTGYTVRFGAIIPQIDRSLKIVIRYLNPDSLVELIEKE